MRPTEARRTRPRSSGVRRWSTRDDEHASDDERMLAKTLLDDFGKFSTDEFTDAPTLNGPDAANRAAELA